MQFRGLTPDELRGALDELDQALFHHDQWHEELNRTLICGLPPDTRDTEENAHRNCRFGQWLYRPRSTQLAQHEGFQEIENIHERMHRHARELLGDASCRKPVSLDRYERFVNALKQMRLEVLTTKREIEDALYNVDSLSGAASRIGMLTKLREQQALVKRKLQSCSIAMMDFDHFKRVNDTHGHAAGDRVIATVAQTIMHQMRPYDMLFRYGGEEFLICQPNSDLKPAFEALDRLREAIAAMQFTGDQGRAFQITVSFGVTLLDPDVSVEQSIERADKALYSAKSAGRNRVAVWNPSITEAA
jgi:diguanylate cyclase